MGCLDTLYYKKQTQFFPGFRLKTTISQKKQTQFKPNSNPIKANNESEIRGAKPIQTQTNPI
jgi:hypothetical protein